MIFEIVATILCKRLDFLGNGITIYDTYKISSNSDVMIKPFGHWNPDYGLTVPNELIWMRRKSLEGLHLR